MVEELDRATKALPERKIQDILKDFSEHITNHSKIEHDLVSNGYHSFIFGMYMAYSEHRPFAISPDMIWLLICQGFSAHIKTNQKNGINLLPSPKEKQKLTVTIDQNPFEDSSVWEKTTNEFTKQIASYIGEELIENLRADFSTTGTAERVASEITIMHTVKAYFEYIVHYCICGIPEITIYGTETDWNKIIKKLSFLKKYNLDSWVEKLLPIIQEFTEASKGVINKDFWRNMFKVHTHDEYGAPKSIDGWIVNFYPYDKDGQKIDLDSIKGLEVENIIQSLPKELVNVDFTFEVSDGVNILDSFPMEYWAGFIGLKQDKENLCLKPEIGWFISKKRERIPQEGQTEYISESKAYYNLDSFPNELFDKNNYEELSLNFISEIKLHKNLKNLNFEMLKLFGIVPWKLRGKLKRLQASLLKKDKRLIINDVWPSEITGFKNSFRRLKEDYKRE